MIAVTRPHLSQTAFLFLMMSILLLARPANAGLVLDEPVLGGRMLVASDGYVTAEFLGSDAGYFNTLYLDVPGDADMYMFDKSSPPGSGPINLGWFTAGTELIFRLDVSNTGESFFTGDADRNADGLAHAMATSILNDAGLYVTTVGFEDLLGGGDLDFNDFEFRLTNVVDPVIPAPTVLALIALGLFGFGLQNRTKASEPHSNASPGRRTV